MIAWNRHRQTRRAAWLAVFALLLQTIIPALHHPASLALGSVSVLDAAQHLCLAQNAGSTTPSDHEKAPKHHAVPVCPMCQAVHAIGGFAPPADPVVALIRATAISLSHYSEAAKIRQRLACQGQPRAPPTLA